MLKAFIELSLIKWYNNNKHGITGFGGKNTTVVESIQLHCEEENCVSVPENQCAMGSV